MMYIYITYIYIILYRRADQAWSARPRNIISDLFPETDRPVVEYGNLTPVMEACGKECFWPQRQVVGLCVLASHILVDVRPTWNIPIINCCVITSKKCCILVMHMNSSSCNNFCRYNMCVRTQMSVQRFPHFVLWQFAVPGAESAAHGKLHHQGIVKMIWESKLNIPNKNSAKLCHLLIRSCYTVLYRWLLLITSIIIYILFLSLLLPLSLHLSIPYHYNRKKCSAFPRGGAAHWHHRGAPRFDAGGANRRPCWWGPRGPMIDGGRSSRNMGIISAR
jgi:hypothetical protein